MRMSPIRAALEGTGTDKVKMTVDTAAARKMHIFFNVRSFVHTLSARL
jgi:hypothetical protein